MKKYISIIFRVLFLLILGYLFVAKAVSAQGQPDIWWPVNNSVLSGLQPFKGMLQNYALNNYQMFWQVDDGQLNFMSDNYTDYPHKEASVDLTNWNWHGSGPYILNFIAKSGSGSIIASKSFTICVNQACGSAHSPTVQPVISPTQQPSPTLFVTVSPTPTAPVSGLPVLPVAGTKFYVDPNSNARQQYLNWLYSRNADAMQILKIADESEAHWFGDWNGNILAEVNKYVSDAAAANSVPVLVAYNIPERDCGGFSAGGANNPSGYQSWISSFAQGIANRKSVVILEPDALANLDCLSPADQLTRYNLISYAVSSLKSKGATVYLDAGNPAWINAAEMATRLKKAGLNLADGFSLNVSNFMSVQSNTDFGRQISAQTGNKHFVIDTGRNGLGPTADFQWCNPAGRALGNRPTTVTGNPLIDAFLWIKPPGESDGNCNGGPAAGNWWAEYALGLAQRAAY